MVLFLCVHGCVPKEITKPTLAEAALIIPDKVYLRMFTESSSVSHWYVFKDHSDRIRFFGSDAPWTELNTVKGEKFIIVYDSIQAGWWDFDIAQCGPFFYPDEKVDTTIGIVSWMQYYGRNPRKIRFNYTYSVGDSFFRKRVDCSDTQLYKGITKNKEFKVIYQPNNKGRAKLLFEPEGYIRELPVRDTLKPNWWHFTEGQCGPSFDKNERLDTTIGKVVWIRSHSRRMPLLTYTFEYSVKDSFFRKSVMCSDKQAYKSLFQKGKEFRVIYNRNNKEKSKMLFDR